MMASRLDNTDCHTVLFMRRGRGSEFVPYHRPKKFPLSLERHRLLKENAYSYRQSSCGVSTQRLEPSLIEPWLDYEATLYDLPRPGQPSQRQPRREDNKPDMSTAFPEDLNMSFHSGLLDSTMDVTKIAVMNSQAVERSQVVVPDRDDMRGEYSEHTESLYPTNDPTNKTSESSNLVDGDHSNLMRSDDGLLPTRIDPTKQELPLLFYPRTTKRSKPPTHKLQKFSKRPRYK